ncbi:hypothetical protein FJZ17_02040 [Candidatus Pacearchaeota archaeon]|nr:hypothetical protein [Candidatus Pacearchaeota archaeon]
MAGEEFIGNLSTIAGNQTGDILRSVFGILTNVPGFDLLVKIFQVVGILFIIYLVFMIIRAFAGWKSARKLSIIAKNIEEINSKLDSIIGKKSKIKK